MPAGSIHAFDTATWSLDSPRERKARARRGDADRYVTHDNDHIEAFEGGLR